jgi:hypothetical protein
MVSMLVTSAVDCVFEPWSGQTKDYEIGDDDVRFVVDQHVELDFYSASSLKQQSADRHVAPLGHSSWRGVLDTTLCDKVCQ